MIAILVLLVASGWAGHGYIVLPGFGHNGSASLVARGSILILMLEGEF
jgi:hypothetical protein